MLLGFGNFSYYINLIHWDVIVKYFIKIVLREHSPHSPGECGQEAASWCLSVPAPAQRSPCGGDMEIIVVITLNTVRVRVNVTPSQTHCRGTMAWSGAGHVTCINSGHKECYRYIILVLSPMCSIMFHNKAEGVSYSYCCIVHLSRHSPELLLTTPLRVRWPGWQLGRGGGGPLLNKLILLTIARPHSNTAQLTVFRPCLIGHLT